jgi:hypothetical protein
MIRLPVLLIAILAAGCAQPGSPAPPGSTPESKPLTKAAKARQELFDEIRPVKLRNCEFERVGDSYDGGYLICKNLVSRAEAFYSYGISASDRWGCTLSERAQKPVHQYDCFELKRPSCGGAMPVFHEECVGPRRETIDGRPYDTIEAQIARNGDAGKHLVMKMDVEGSEWPSFLATPDAVLARIDQLVVEFHGVEEPQYAEVLRKLKKQFYVVNLHYNNWTCSPDVKPLQATAFEVLFVNKNVGVVAEGGTPVVPNPLDAPNNQMRPDCQVTPTEYWRPPA